MSMVRAHLMFVWKVDVGYIDLHEYDAYRATEIPFSVIHITDKNRYFSIMETGGFSSGWKDIDPIGLSEVASDAMAALGEQYWHAYGPGYYYRTEKDFLNWYQAMTTVLPSFTQMYPNLWKFLRDNPIIDTDYHFAWVMMFKEVGIALISGISSYDVWSIGVDKLEILPGDFGDYRFLIGAENTWFTVPFINKFVDEKNFVFGTFQVKINTTPSPDEILAATFNPTDSRNRNILYLLLEGGHYTKTEPPINPYEPIGPSEPTDPNQPPGSFDNTSDPIPDSSLPALSAADTGFTRIYNPSLSQIKQLAQYLWTTPDVIQTIWNHIKQFFEDPMQAIIGFNLVPVPVPNGGTTTFKLMFIDTGVSMTAAANQFVDRDCGSVKLERYYGSALDQSPHTKVSCFLPFIGTVQLNTDEVMGTTLQVKYRVDICSGSCVAKIFVDGSCLYQYSGHCAINVPISSADFSSYVSAAIGVASTAIGLAAAGAAGAAGAALAPEAAQQTNQIVTTTQTTQQARNPATGRLVTAGRTTTVETREAPADQSSTQASFGGLTPANVANTVGDIMGSKPHIAHSGAFSGNSGYLGVRRPFLIIERPNLCMPAQFQQFNGFPAMITMELSTCEGFTRVQQVQLTGMTATNPEQAEILELLKSGVIF